MVNVPRIHYIGHSRRDSKIYDFTSKVVKKPLNFFFAQTCAENYPKIQRL